VQTPVAIQIEIMSDATTMRYWRTKASQHYAWSSCSNYGARGRYLQITGKKMDPSLDSRPSPFLGEAFVFFASVTRGLCKAIKSRFGQRPNRLPIRGPLPTKVSRTLPKHRFLMPEAGTRRTREQDLGPWADESR
jgi:hypothetical protein